MPEQSSAIHDTARALGALVIDCADAAGRIGAVADRIGEQSGELGGLSQVVERVGQSHRVVNDAVGRARNLSSQVRAKLEQNRVSVEESVELFSSLTELVLRMGERINGLSAALAEVRGVSDVIGGIATQTNLLALNATIEAARAGVEGRAFAVVAAEVKRLAQSTKGQAGRITRTLDALNAQATEFIGELDDGMVRGRCAQQGLARIGASVADLGEIVDLVDEESDGISTAVARIGDSMADVGSDIVQFARALQANSARLGEARLMVNRLEADANGTLDRLAMSGADTDDRTSIERAIAIGREITDLIEGAVRRGEIGMAAVFDTDYRPVPGTNPQQLTTGFNAFADRHIRPLLDRVSAERPQMIGCVICDVNGYLPTHLTLRSQPQGPDPEWNATWSRNRRILLDDATRRASASDAPAMLNCYRMALGGGEYLPIKTVFVPLRFGGRRWGNYEYAYIDAQNERSEAIGHAALTKSLEQSRARGSVTSS